LLGCFHTVLTHKHASNSCKYIGNDDNHACTLSPFPKTTIICGVFAPMRLLLIIQTKKKLAVFLAYIIYIYAPCQMFMAKWLNSHLAQMFFSL
jgi:hypothetical protein